MKTNKSLTKRIKITKNGKIKRKRMGTSHLLSHKTAKRKRRLRKSTFVKGAYAAKMKANINN